LSTVLGIGRGIWSAFVSHNLIYPIRCPMDGVHRRGTEYTVAPTL
jgi:hypothetical protein